MTTLHALIPDADMLLALAPEELAPILLRLAKQDRVNHNNMFTTATATPYLYGANFESNGDRGVLCFLALDLNACLRMA